MSLMTRFAVTMLFGMELAAAFVLPPTAPLGAVCQRRSQGGKLCFSLDHSVTVTDQLTEVPAKTKKSVSTEVASQPLILVVEDTQAQEQLDSGWELVLLNDDFNSRHHVARTLVMVCALTDDQAYEVMMQAHRFGSAVVGQYTKETAEGYCNALLAAGIGCEVVKADDAE